MSNRCGSVHASAWRKMRIVRSACLAVALLVHLTSSATGLESASSLLVFQEDFEGETSIPTNPEVNQQLFPFGLLIYGDGGGNPLPILTGSAVHASVSASGASRQYALLPPNDLGPAPLRFRGTFSGFSIPSGTTSRAGLSADFDPLAGSGITVGAEIEMVRNAAGVLIDGYLEIYALPAGGGMSTTTGISLPNAEAVAIAGGAAWTLDLDVDRDLALADATITIEGFSPHSAGPINIDPSVAGGEVGYSFQTFDLVSGALSEAAEVDFDSFEIHRLYSRSFLVDTLADEVDALPGDGVCATASSACSLRAAIQESNAVAGADEVVLPPGHYTLSIPGAEEDASATGDLDISDDLALRGGGRRTTVVDGAMLDRVFETLYAGTGPAVHIMDLEITNGAAVTAGGAIGGGVENRARLALHRCIISGNKANLAGGVMNRQRMVMDDCWVHGNEALDLGFTNDRVGGVATSSTSAGGGSHVEARIENSAIVENIAVVTGGLAIENAGMVFVGNTTISGNSDQQVSVYNANASLLNVTIVGDSGAGIRAGSYDGTHTLSIANSAISGVPACSLSTTLPIMTDFYGHNASNDTSCGLTSPGDVEGVSLGLGPLVTLGGTAVHFPTAGSPLIDTAETDSCLSRDQLGADRPLDGDESGTPECDLGAIEVPEPGIAVGLATGGLLLAGLGARRRGRGLRRRSPTAC